MALDINTKKIKRRARSDIDKLFDLYWSGTPRRITGLTLRILGVNFVALGVLMIGVVHLAQYQKGLIANKLESFNRESKIIASQIHNANDSAYINTLAELSGYEIRLIYNQKTLLSAAPQTAPTSQPSSLFTLNLLRQTISYILGLLPDNDLLPQINPDDIPGLIAAEDNKATLGAWRDLDNHIVLTATLPLNDGRVLMIRRPSNDITRDVGDMWIRILQVFLVTLIVTIFISIYLSGLIARPLRQLARAAEAIRSNPENPSIIPDLSKRKDEIGELSLVMRDMTKSLRHRIDSIDRFASDVAHELKNPLTSLKSATETLSKIKKPKDREKLMKIIEHDITRMDRLITDTARISRLDSALMRQNLEPIAIIDVIRTVTQRHNDAAKNITIAFHNHAGNDLEIWGIEDRLLQVFDNLITNALSFSKPGDFINIVLNHGGNQAIITIDDQGAGIPTGKLETIFERFYSERPAHEDYGTHSGLGLYICREIIHALGGEIVATNIQNTQGEVLGARFTLILRVVEKG